MRARGYQANFTMGRVAAEVHGRVDMEIYADAVAEAENYIPAVTGPLRRRAGFMHEGEPKFGDRVAICVPFVRTLGDALQLEFGDGYLRIRNADGSPVMDGEAAYEVVSPYADEDLAGLRFHQSNDILYITHVSRRVRPRVLQRQGDTAWEFKPLEARYGPWRRENTVETFTVTVTVGTATEEVDPTDATIGSILGPGTVTLTASAALFDPDMVGGLFRLRQSNGNPGVDSWSPKQKYDNGGTYVLSDGKVYARGAGVNPSGTTPPLHDRGSVSDGKFQWAYRHDGAGIVRITAVAGATSATAEIVSNVPFLSGTATEYWSEGAWSEHRGWPGHVTETDDDRLAFSGPYDEPGRRDITRTAGYGPDWVDFKPGQGTGRVLDEDAIAGNLGAGGDAVTWMATATYLMMGTVRREFVISGETLEEPLSPAGAKSRGLSAVGGEAIDPPVVHDGILFVPRGGRGLRHLRLSTDQQTAAADLGYFVEDILNKRIAGIAWAPQPDNIAWIWTQTGELLSVVYKPDQNMFGWSTMPLPGGFKVEWASVLPGDDGRDTLWLNVFRTKNGAPQRAIWRQAARWVVGDPLDRVIYLDASERYDGAATSVLAGLDHLEGDAVRVFVDGGRLLFDAVVTDGEVLLPEGETCTKACVGLRYLSRVVSLPPDLQGPAGSVGMLQRAFDVTVYLADAVNARVGALGHPLETVAATLWAGAPRPRSLVEKRNIGADADRIAQIVLEADDAWPCTLRAWRFVAEVGDD